jgi:hypothetical protein
MERGVYTDFDIKAIHRAIHIRGSSLERRHFPQLSNYAEPRGGM